MSLKTAIDDFGKFPHCTNPIVTDLEQWDHRFDWLQEHVGDRGKTWDNSSKYIGGYQWDSRWYFLNYDDMIEFALVWG
jgi:hypothetical protein